MKIHGIWMMLLILLTACGQEAQIEEENGNSAPPKVTLTLSCEENLEKCGKMAMALSAPGFPLGTTMTTTIDGSSATSYHMDYSATPTTQTYTLADGTYCVSKTRVYPPATTFSTRSLVQVQAGNACFTIRAPQVTKVTITVAILDQDGDGIHDYIDSHPTDACKPNPIGTACQQSGSAGTVISGNDNDGDGCANSVDPQPNNPAVGCSGTTGTTSPTVTWDPSVWYEWIRGVTNRSAVKYTDPVYGTMITATIRSGLLASDDQKFYWSDGPVTAGTNRTLAGEILCDKSGVINSLVMNANTWAQVSGYYTTAVTANTLVKFSYAYTALVSASSKLVQHELGQLPSGANCRMRNLVDK